MFLLTLNIIWSFTFFFYNLYLLFIISLILYILPLTNDVSNYFKHKNVKNFEYILGFDLYAVVCTLPILVFFLLFSWISPATSSWFGHICFTAYQLKISYLIILFFVSVLSAYATILYFSTKEIFDYFIVCFNFFFWIFFLFYANTLFTVIFFIEILSTLTFLLLVVSTFSTTYFYKNINLNLHSYFHKTTPFFFIQSLLFFFWISLISSLNLFLFLFLFYLKFLTLDWNVFEHIFLHLFLFTTIKNSITSAIIWFNLLFCIFLKCGLVPFFFWKPVFFKGLPMHVLMFYVTFFYFFIFLFFLFFLINYANEIFYAYAQINIILLVSGILVIFFILCESYYIKTFLALSSILNTLFIFLTINGVHISDAMLF